MKCIKVLCPFKSAFIWVRTRTRPALEKDTTKEKVVFCFPDTEEVKAALNDFFRDDCQIKSFVDHYKLLRNEMYLLKGTEGMNNHEAHQGNGNAE